MENLSNKIHDEFQSISFGKWKEEAQKTLKGRSLDEVLTKKLTDNISVQSIYDKTQVEKYFDLDISSKEIQIDNTFGIASITELPCESDFEIAVLIDYIRRNSFENITLNVRIDSNFFLSIAKFRAVRFLLSQINNIYFSVIAQSTNFNKSATDIENNIIRLTTEAMSAIIGGADKVSLDSYNSLRQNDEFGTRITNNILILLEKESYMMAVNDPLSGSYLIENLTNQFIKSVQTYTSELENYESQSNVDIYVKETAQAYNSKLISDLDSQKKKLIGVNIYQNKKDTLEVIQVDDNRAISSFEELKMKIDKVNPKVYIANFEETSKLQAPINIALNTYNIPFQISGIFELVEDAFNAIKLYDPDLVIVNANDDITRIMNNMLSEYKVLNINEFSTNSILKNVGLIVNKLEQGV